MAAYLMNNSINEKKDPLDLEEQLNYKELIVLV